MFFTDNTSRVFLLLKPIKFSLDELHAGYPLRYLKEQQELSVNPGKSHLHLSTKTPIDISIGDVSPQVQLNFTWNHN